MREQKIEVIRKACIAANPEIMELKFGCALQRPESHVYMVIEDVTWGRNTKEVWVNSVPFGSMSLPLHVSKEEILDGIPDHNGEVWQVLGRTIRLEDVLFAIEKTLDYETAFGGMAALCLPKSLFGNVRWDLLKDLTDQSDECLQFLANILK